MGPYNSYGKNQIQIHQEEWDITANFYEIGDKVPISDGIYVDAWGNGGFIIVKDGILIAEFDVIKVDHHFSVDSEQFMELYRGDYD